jgi:hypothetical protein
MRCTPGVFFIVAQRSSRCLYTLLLIELPTPVEYDLLRRNASTNGRKTDLIERYIVNFKVSIIKLSLLINYETSCDKLYELYDLNIIKCYFKNKVQLFVVFMLP